MIQHESPRVQDKLAWFQNELNTVQYYKADTNQFESHVSQIDFKLS